MSYECNLDVYIPRKFDNSIYHPFSLILNIKYDFVNNSIKTFHIE